MEREHKKGTPVTVTATGQEGTVIGRVDDVSKYLVQLDSGIAVLMYPDEITPQE